jgi:predicted nucleic acid-binding protein
MGPIRQEILSGVRLSRDFITLQRVLSGFESLEVQETDYDQAAGYFNACQSHGITASDVDMLICAVAARNRVPVFTTDNDFKLYAERLPVRLHAA